MNAEISYISNVLSNLSFALLAISPTIFIFSVTLLGAAIEQAQQEENAARENDKANLQKEIDQLEKSIPQARKDGNANSLTTRLDDLKKQQESTEQKIKDIKIKYHGIDLTNSVIRPCLAFIIAAAINPLSAFLLSQLLTVVLIFLQIILILYGIYKIYRCLALVQEISVNKKESEGYSRLKETIKLAMHEYDQGKEDEVSVIFVDKAFPLNTTIDTELNVRFRIKLIKGNVLKNVYIWFFIADGFGLINPAEDQAWKQASDYDVPNIRTVKIHIGTLSKGPYTPGTLVIKTPSIPGKYLLRYKVYADGFSGSANDLSILIG